MRKPPAQTGDAECARFVQKAREFSARGQYLRAEKCLLHALTLVRGSSEQAPALWNELGMVCKYAGKLDSSERYYRMALRRVRRLPKSQEQQCLLADLYHNLGGLRHARRNYRSAENYACKGLKIRLAVMPSRHLTIASDRAALGAILDGLGRHGESKKLYLQALRTYYREFGPSHPEIAVVLNNMAASHASQGRFRWAEFYYSAALRMKRRELGRSHPDLAVTLNNLALLYSSRGSHARARLQMRQAVAIFNRTLGKTHPNTLAARTNLRNIIRNSR